MNCDTCEHKTETTGHSSGAFCYMFEEEVKNCKQHTGYSDFHKWFDTFVEEKGIDQVYQAWDLESPNGTWNHIDIEVVIEYIQNITDKKIQKTIKDNFVAIDFYNGDVFHFFKHMAQGIVNAHGDM